MNHLPRGSPTREPLRSGRRGCHGPGRAGRPSTYFRVYLRPRPHGVLIGLQTPGDVGDWTKHSSVAVKVSAFLKGPTFPILDGVELAAPLEKFSLRGLATQSSTSLGFPFLEWHLGALSEARVKIPKLAETGLAQW